MPKKLLRRWLPKPHHIREHRLLAWLGPMLHHPRLWHVSREGIALGAAIGFFFGIISPVAQMPLAAGIAIALRANLPVAIAGTFITNPFTFAPLYYLAYRIGLLLMGAEQPSSMESLFDVDAQGLAGWFTVWSERILKLGKPLFIGLAVMASCVSVASYFIINWLWRALTMRAWHRRIALRKTSDNTETD